MRAWTAPLHEGWTRSRRSQHRAWVGIPRSMPLIHGLLLAGGLLAARVFVRIVASEDNEPPVHQYRRERIILIGANRFASSFIQLLNAYASQQQRVIAVLDEDAAMVGRAIFDTRYRNEPNSDRR